MIKIIFAIFLAFNLSHGYFLSTNTHSKDFKTLKDLDIDPSFASENILLGMQDDLYKYKAEYFLGVLGRADIYVPILRKMIKEASIPEIFLYMAMAESNFSAKALSNASASGMWQFMPYTASLYNLEINSYIDERRDPIKSTQAAIKYLKNLHDKFGKWYLAAIAYNCGEGTLEKAITKAGSDDLKKLIDPDKKYLPKETRLYIRKIILMSMISTDFEYIAKNESEHLLNRGSAQNIDVVNIDGGVSLIEIAKSAKLSLKELKQYNFQYKYDFLPPFDKKYKVYIPNENISTFSQNFDPKQSRPKFLVHIVKKGETVLTISKKYQIDPKVLKDINKLKSNALKTNIELTIPVLDAPKPQPTIYVVQHGGTIEVVSKKFGKDPEVLRKANNLKSNILKKGDRIVIP